MYEWRALSLGDGCQGSVSLDCRSSKLRGPETCLFRVSIHPEEQQLGGVLRPQQEAPGSAVTAAAATERRLCRRTPRHSQVLQLQGREMPLLLHRDSWTYTASPQTTGDYASHSKDRDRHRDIHTSELRCV